MAIQNINSLSLMGGNVRSLSFQLGLNTAPTVVTAEIIGITSLPSNSIDSLLNITVGGVIFNGIVQSVDLVEIDKSGKDILSVRLTDTKQVLAAKSMFLGGSSFSETGGLVSIPITTTDDIEKGITFSRFKTAVESVLLAYGKNIYRVTIAGSQIPSRPGGNEYRIKIDGLTIMDIIQKIASDNGMEWFVDTSIATTIRVVFFNRTNINGPLLSTLAPQNLTYKRNRGLERGNLPSRTVVYGPNRQTLVSIDGNRLRPLIGPGAYPESVMMDVLNDRSSRNDIDSIRRYMDEFWGRKFFFEINPSQFDQNGRSFIEISDRGFAESTFFPRAVFDRFSAEDGRIMAFVRIPSPFIAQGNTTASAWDDSVKLSRDVFFLNNQWYMRCFAERSDRFVIVTLPVPLTYNRHVGLPHHGVIEKARFQTLGTMALPVIDMRNRYGPWVIGPITGLTKILIDNNINPWEFGFRGITLAQANSIQQQVANALAQAHTGNPPIDTGELEFAGLPTLNIGAFIGRGGIINNININYSTGGVTTSIKARSFTDGLARHLLYYQDLIEDLMRRTREIRDRLKRDEPLPPFDPSPPQRSITQGELYQVVERAPGSILSGQRPVYNVRRVRESVSGGVLTYVPESILIVTAINRAEPPGAPGRVLPGTIVNVQRSATSGGRFFDLSANPPTSSGGTVQELTGARRYRVTLTNAEPKLSSSELDLLNSVENLGEPINSPGRLLPGTSVTVTWNQNPNGTVTPTINVPVQIFGLPGGG